MVLANYAGDLFRKGVGPIKRLNNIDLNVHLFVVSSIRGSEIDGVTYG